MDQNNLMFEFFEDIEHQGIKKLVDSNGRLTQVGTSVPEQCSSRILHKLSALNL